MVGAPRECWAGLSSSRDSCWTQARAASHLELAGLFRVQSAHRAGFFHFTVPLFGRMTLKFYGRPRGLRSVAPESVGEGEVIVVKELP